MRDKVKLSGKGIKAILSSYKPEQALAEFIWNGFDAQATEVRIDFIS